MMKRRKLRMGMVGGGLDAFIGSVHRMAANLDGQVELVCGAFSINHEISEKESKLPESERMEFVTIVTPNFIHFDPAKLALENGFNVVIEKPMTFNLEEAIALKKLVEETGLTLALTHTYSGYPMVKE